MIEVGVCHNARGRARFAAPALVWALVGALGGAAGCAVVPAAKGLDPTARAEAATARADWPLAAELWYDLFLESGGRDRRASFEAARALLLAGDGASACGLCEQGLRAHPADPDLLELRARIQADNGFRRAAEDSLVTVVSDHPQRASALLLLGRIRVELGLEHEAVAPLSRATRLLPQDPEAWRLLGDACRGAGLAHRAFEAYERAISFGDESAETRLRAAETAIEPGVRETDPNACAEAFEWLAEVLERDPQATRAHFLVARLCEEVGRGEEAIGHYRRAVETDLACLEALTNLAILYADRGRVEETRRMVDRALTLEPVPRRREALSGLVRRAESVARERESAGRELDGVSDAGRHP